MAAEFLQFAVVLGAFVVVALVWLRAVFVPGRTLERWEDQRPDRRGEGRGGPGWRGFFNRASSASRPESSPA